MQRRVVILYRRFGTTYRSHHQGSRSPRIKCWKCTPWRSKQTLKRRSLLSKCHTVSRYKRQCNFTHAFKGCVAFPAPIFMKLASAQQHCVQISYSEIHPKLDNKCGKYSAAFTASFLRNLQYSVDCCGHLLHRMLSKSDGTCRKYGENFHLRR